MQFIVFKVNYGNNIYYYLIDGENKTKSKTLSHCYNLLYYLVIVVEKIICWVLCSNYADSYYEINCKLDVIGERK